MKVQLKSNYVLTDEHTSTSHGQPVLLNEKTGESYMPMDVFEPSESWGTLLARAAVKKMARNKACTEEERQFIQKFTKSDN
jgi:hypothetical protein